MQRHILSASLAFALLAASSAQAGLIGQQVTGRLSFNGGSTNYFDPLNGFVPAGYLNTGGTTVTIADPAMEFGFRDSANLDIANFTDAQVIISDQIFSNGAFPWLMTFTSVTPGLFQGLTLVSESFNPNLTYSLDANTLTFNWKGTGRKEASYQAVFNVASSNNVPEPGSLALLALSLIGVGYSLRRKVFGSILVKC